MSDDDSSMDLGESFDMIDRLYGGSTSSPPVGQRPVATVLFQSSEVEDQLEASASSLSQYQYNHHHMDSPKEYSVPLEKVGRNYRCLKRRGAAVHSQLLKNAFEASMDSYDSDGGGEGDDFSMHASNSTICSRDGVEEVHTPRKRIRHPVDVNGGEQQQQEDETESSINEASNMFGGLGLAMQQQSNMFGGLGLATQQQQQSAVAASSSANSVSSEDSDTIPEHLEHTPNGDTRRRIQRTLSCALKREHYQG
jgi:hypothetical protein